MVTKALVVDILLVLCSIEKLASGKCDQVVPKLQDGNKTMFSDHQPLVNYSYSCPPWSYCDKDERSCKCKNLPGDPIRCEGNPFATNINNAYILDCYCATYNDGYGIIEVGQCDFNCATYRSVKLIDEVYNILPPNLSDWNNFMCGEFNRSGTLCGSCDAEKNLYPRAYSFNLTCIECENGASSWWKYIISAYLPLTIFYLIILILKVDVHSSHLKGFIIFSQVLTIPPMTRNLLLASRNKTEMHKVMQFLATLFGIWNLDFFRTYNNTICLPIGSLSNLFLDLAVAVYPIVLMMITYILITLYDQNFKILIYIWKPFKIVFYKLNRQWSVKTTLLDAIATFLFLANMKLLSVCFDTLTPVQVFQFSTTQHVSVSWRVYYDSSIVYFSFEHRVYAIIALVILLLTSISPIIILILYSSNFFQKSLTLFPHRWQIFFHTFMDSFQGCYKDGTESDGRDCRWYAPILPICRLLLMVVYGFTLGSAFFSFGAILFTVIVLITIISDPFKSQYLSSTMSVFILFIAAFYVCAVGVDMAEKNDTNNTYVFYGVIAVICSLPLFYISLLVLIWIISHWKLNGRKSRKNYIMKT